MAADACCPGTPSPTRPLDLFLQAHILRPGLLGDDKYQFIKAYCHVERTPFFTGKCPWKSGVQGM
jgi:hypothetical protein